MTTDKHPGAVVGNPVRRDLLLRTLRSNVNASILVGWTALIAVVGAIVLVDRVGLSQAFAASEADPEVVGRALGQWWVVSITVAMGVFAPVSTVVACAGPGERRRLEGWSGTLVRPGRIVTGIWAQQLALVALALVLALPVAGFALALGGTTPAQLGIGLAGAAVVGATTGALALGLACRSSRVFRPLAATLAVVLALHAVPAAIHQSTGNTLPDPVYTVVPVVAVADAAAPHGPDAPGATAAEAPLERLRAHVRPNEGSLPPWAWAALGAGGVTLVFLGVARIRLARPPRR